MVSLLPLEHISLLWEGQSLRIKISESKPGFMSCVSPEAPSDLHFVIQKWALSVSCPFTEQSAPVKITRHESTFCKLQNVIQMYGIGIPASTCQLMLSGILPFSHLCSRHAPLTPLSVKLPNNYFNFPHSGFWSSFCPKGSSPPYLPDSHQLIFQGHAKPYQAFFDNLLVKQSYV